MLGALRRPATYAGGAREIASLLSCARHYPSGVLPGRAPAPGASLPAEGHRTPVMLVHGFGHNRSGWWVLRRHLAEAGFPVVDSFNYNPMTRDVPANARRLAARIEMLRRSCGADKVHIVGHSLGGILARWFVQELDGASVVDTVVTIGTPHEGTMSAWAVPGRTISELRPGSWVVRRLEASARRSDVNWVAIYSNVDELVMPSRSAMLRHPALDAVNILAKDHGHVSMMISPLVARTVVHQLEAAEGVEGVATLSDISTVAPAGPAGVPAAATATSIGAPTPLRTAVGASGRR